MKNIKRIALLLFLFSMFSVNLEAQNTQEQVKLIKMINVKLKKVKKIPNWGVSIKIVDRKLKIVNEKLGSHSLVEINKIKKIKATKSGNYYKIKINAPWGVKTSTDPNWKGGSTGMQVSMDDKNAVKELVTDLKKLISLYK